MKHGFKITKALHDVVDHVVLIILILLCIYGVYSLWDNKQIGQGALSKQYKQYKPTKEDELSFQELQEINPDVFGWLTVYGTHIDYPITYTDNNKTYENTNAKGEYSLTGSIYLDYRNNIDFTDFNSIIYGHHMAENAMFGELDAFGENEFFDSHKYGNIYYQGKDHGLEFFACMEADAYDWELYNPAITGDDAKQAYLDKIFAEALQTRDIGVSIDDNIVLLSTCSSDLTNGRFVLVGRISDEVFTDTFNNEELADEDEESLTIWQKFMSLSLTVKILLIALLILILLLLIFILIRRKRRKEQQDNQQNEK